MKTYQPTIGLEIHSELNTKSKMFCGCKNDPHSAKPNTHVCPICLAHPGTLPSVNQGAVRKVLLVGQALSGELASYSEFDRKNYFYPDIPKAYQLSQYAYPFVRGGELKGIKITRVHLEEDTARSQHNQGNGSLVDFNRAGVPLMELVTEPVIHSAKEASDFGKELQLLLKTLNVSNANMERGELRLEANISVSPTATLGTKVEVKNLNSFKAVEQAIDFEVKRQVELLERGERVIQETRGWEETKNKTFSQRSKENAEEYRYFPDPDIPKFELGQVEEFSSSRLTEIMPELPNETRVKFISLGLKSEQVESIILDSSLLTFFRAVLEELGMEVVKTQTAANYLTSDIFGLLQADTLRHLETANASPFAALIEMVVAGKVTSRVAKDLLLAVVFEGADPETLATTKGLLQNNSNETLIPIVESVIAEHSGVVSEYQRGKESALQFLVGQVMKVTHGSANPQLLVTLFKERLKK